MVQVPQRTTPGAPALVRLLARLAQLDVAEPGQSLADRLGQWLSWTDAITLSSALSTRAPAHADARSAGDDAERICARVRTALTNAIAGASGVVSSAGRRTASRAPVRRNTADPAPEFAVFRQDYLTMQQTMQTDIGLLRERLRRQLMARTPELARLAALDASLEQALDARERALLATVPTLLGVHFERLREAGQQMQADVSEAAMPAAARAWLGQFRLDMQRILLAELEIRFQPIAGLLAALRTC
ncbi:hypothetical protein PATSB16_36140 [Pandoraea thiooxydans]|uniref:DUF3348 domain-containing protein n=1 Tax=Pandoraea thiooxydans TaxID=445709 RepID=A0A0G3EVC1_9BURK|nr:DUF3348 domain-containing protein [Pandoraea thiooxydans]AKJ69332.1 hypothetical protein ABW99_15005 [Pandoraea thiooxydans]APR96950.1 hypothetical protein PATSB16_36140 [Pandoraea thiooxydans]